MPTPNVHNGLSILDDMFSDSADDIVLFYRTFDHVALAPALRCTKPVDNGVVAPAQIQKRRDDQIAIIEGALYSMLSDMIFEFIIEEPAEAQDASFYNHVMEICVRVVHRCTREAMSLDASIQQEFVS